MQVSGVQVLLEMRAALAADTPWASKVLLCTPKCVSRAHARAIATEGAAGFLSCFAPVAGVQGDIVAEQQLPTSANILQQLDVTKASAPLDQQHSQQIAGEGSLCAQNEQCACCLVH